MNQGNHIKKGSRLLKLKHIKLYNLLLLSTYIITIPSNVQGGKTTIEHVFDDSIHYEGGEFLVHKTGARLFAEPNKPSISPTQSVRMYNGNPLLLPSEEKILKRIIPGVDGRERVENTIDWPNLLHGQLTMKYSDGEYGGSGVLIGPHHLLTAAHNVYDVDKKEWAHSISVRLGLNEVVAPFGEIKVAKAYTFDQWVQNKDFNYDIALITLGNSIGYKTGWAGVVSLEDESLVKKNVTITGYPGDMGFNKMMKMSHRLKLVNPERFYYDIDTYGGQSGSGIWIQKFASPYVIGVHTLGEGALYTGNSGVRLSSPKFHKIAKWISQSFTLSSQNALSREETPVISPLPSVNPDPEDSQTLFSQGWDYANKPNLSRVAQHEADREALRLFHKAASQGNASAENWIGTMYYKGRVEVSNKYEVNEDEAYKWFRKAAQKGLAQAQDNLAVMYQYGKGTPQNFQKATFWLKKVLDNETSTAEQKEKALARIKMIEKESK